MNIDFIYRQIKRIKRKYQQDDPFRLCREMGILVTFTSMGTSANACKGFFLRQSRIGSITINSDLPCEIQRIILVHELGHAILHSKVSGIKTFHDFELFDRTSFMEYEANIFAAEFLLNDEDVLELLNSDLSFFNAASTLCVPPELLDFKFRMMKRNGYKLIDSPITPNSNFIKSMPTNI